MGKGDERVGVLCGSHCNLKRWEKGRGFYRRDIKGNTNQGDTNSEAVPGHIDDSWSDALVTAEFFALGKTHEQSIVVKIIAKR